METIWNFLLIGGFLLFMLKFGCGRHMLGHGSHSQAKGHETTGAGPESRSTRRQDLVWEHPAKDVDPVCEKTVETENAKTSVFAGNVYYFCSRECREAFEAAPGTYVTPLSSGLPQSLEHKHGS